MPIFSIPFHQCYSAIVLRKGLRESQGKGQGNHVLTSAFRPKESIDEIVFPSQCLQSPRMGGIDGRSIIQWKGKNAREAEADYRRVAEEIQQDWGKLWMIDNVE
jgi:hypothetical protein